MTKSASHPGKKPDNNHKIEVIAKVVLQHLPHETAAAQLGVTTRQVRRLVKAYKEGGPLALIHQGKGRPAANRVPDDFRAAVMDLVRKSFPDTGPQLISDELEDLHEITVNPETLRRWMMEEGLWSREKAKAVHRSGGTGAPAQASWSRWTPASTTGCWEATWSGSSSP